MTTKNALQKINMYFSAIKFSLRIVRVYLVKLTTNYVKIM